MQGSNYTAADSLRVDPEEYGIDWEGPAAADEEYDHHGISLPTGVEPPINKHEIDELKRTVNPMERSADFGVDLYRATAEFVASKLV